MSDPNLRFSARTSEFACADPFALFETLRNGAAISFFWKGRDNGEIWMGFGFAGCAGNFTESREVLNGILLEDPPFEPRAFCAVPFDRVHESGAPWTNFSFPLFVLPHITIRCRNGKADALAVRAFEGGSPSKETLEKLDLDLKNIGNPEISEEVHSRHRETIRTLPRTQPGEWQRRVGIALCEMERAPLRKVVLSRTVTAFCDQPIRVSAVLSELCMQEGCSVFALGMGDDVFLGATPERLFAVEDRLLSTESLAGTRPRGRTDREDKKFAAALLESEKERREHDIVREFIEARLQQVCSGVETGQPAVRKLSHVQHLYTPLRGTLRRGIGLDEVLDTLHPTPAVCGDPRDAALDFIRSNEQTPRGYYAGALGWLDKQSAEMAVAIRCALIRGNSAVVFAGAGIVPGSDPHAEWEETENKMQPMLRALGWTGAD